MADAIEVLLAQKATLVARILGTPGAAKRVLSFEPRNSQATAQFKSYRCPVCWVQAGVRGELKMEELPYTKDWISRCLVCNDLTKIPGQIINDLLQ